MRLHRFYLQQSLGEDFELVDKELVFQIKNVLRKKEGDSVTIFSGSGYDFLYEIEKFGEKNIKLSFKEKKESILPKKNITLYLSIIKKDNFELVLQKAVELGVKKVVGIISSRSEKKDLNMERLEKIKKEALEQSGRGDDVVISPIISLEEALNGLDSNDVNISFSLNGESLGSFKSENKNINLFVGPEGGWTEEEEKMFKEKGVKGIALTETTLRAETASIVGIGIFVLC